MFPTFCVLPAMKKQKLDHHREEYRNDSPTLDSRSPSPDILDRSRSPVGSSGTPEPSPRSLDSPSPTTIGSKSDSKTTIEEGILASYAGGKRQPIEMLCRIFPHMKRSVLQLILQGCGGDVVQSIEHILNSNGDGHSLATSIPTSSLITPHGVSASLANSSAFRSAFSPISTTLANAHSLSSMRYAWGGMGGRGLALAMPYPSVIPGLTMGSSYPGYAGLTGEGASKPFHYAMYPCCPPKPFTSPSSEKTGCIGE